MRALAPQVRAEPSFVTVVIPVRNGAATIREQLEALACQTYVGSWEVLVVDDGCTDPTEDIVRSFASRLPHLRVLKVRGPGGLNVARNLGARSARGEFIAFADADDVADPRWLKELVRASVCGDIIAARLDDHTLNDGPHRHWRVTHRPDDLSVAMSFLPYAVGASVAVWRSVFDQLGGFREDYPTGGDDLEFSWRAQLAGARLHFAPRAVVHYRYRSTLRDLVRQAYRNGRAGPRLYVDFRDYGLPRPRLRAVASDILWLLTRSAYVLGPHRRRGHWLRRAALFAGRVRGSLEVRTVFLA